MNTQLDDEAIEKFKNLYLKEYGVELTRQQALDYGVRLIGLVKAIYGTNPPDIDKSSRKENNKTVVR